MEPESGPSWKHRRRLIYGAYALSAFMILFAAATYQSDTEIGTQLIVGGVSLISIIVTAYTGFATLDDRWHYRPRDRYIYGDTEDENYENSDLHDSAE